MTNETCEERERLERFLAGDLSLVSASFGQPSFKVYEIAAQGVSKLAQHISTCPLCKGEDDE